MQSPHVLPRGCQNGSVHVWTLPQGGTTVSLPNIKNSLPSQNQSSRTPRVSLDLLLELLIQFVMILSDPAIKLSPSYSFFFTAGECKVCVCTSRPYHSSEVPFILLQWTGSGLRGDWRAAQHLVFTGQRNNS